MNSGGALAEPVKWAHPADFGADWVFDEPDGMVLVPAFVPCQKGLHALRHFQTRKE
jgi:hypothetical protein